MWKKILSIVLALVVWGGIVAYVIWAWRLTDEHHSLLRVASVEVEITDRDQVEILSADEVAGWIDTAGMSPVGRLYDSIDTRQVNEMVASHNFVSESNTYLDFSRTMHVEVAQRRPILRVASQAGAQFYLTDDRYVEPIVTGAAQYVPIITGTLPLPFPNEFRGDLEKFVEDNEKKSDKNYLFLCKLINFVEYIEQIPFWRAQIVQINLTGGVQSSDGVEFREPHIELVPRVGSHIIKLGKLDDYQSKLRKLYHFYQTTAEEEGWLSAEVIDIAYDNEVIIRRTKNE